MAAVTDARRHLILALMIAGTILQVSATIWAIIIAASTPNMTSDGSDRWGAIRALNLWQPALVGIAGLGCDLAAALTWLSA